MSAESTAPIPRASKQVAWLRSLPRRFLDYVWDNPSAEHDARTILSSPKVGLWLGIEVLLIIVACGFAVFLLPEMERELRHLEANVGAGSYLIGTTLIIVTAFLTLMVPLRASGLLEGPRWRGYMDQLVTTGVSPMRYFAGKWATSQPFFLALLGASIPFVVLFGLLGDASWSRTAVSYVVLYAYCNLLLIVTFGLGTVLHEVAAIVITWLLFCFFLVIAFTPTPSALAALTPIRFLIQPFVEIVLGSDAGVLGPIYGGARLFGLAIPWPVWALSLWGLVVALMGVTCMLGPLHAYVPGMNNFGAVVLPGDGRRVFFRRLRPFLTRRVELAFLFENRGPLLMRWTLPLRSLQQFGALTLIAVLLYSCVFDPTFVRNMRRMDLLALHGAATSIVLGVSVFVFASGRSDALQRFKLGPFAIPQVVFDAGAFVCFLGALVCLHVVGFAVAWTDLLQSRAAMWGIRLSPEETYLNASSNLAVLCTVAISTFLFLKVVGSRILSRGGVFLVGVVYLVALFLVPLLATGAAAALSATDQDLIRRFSLPFFVVGEISPGIQLMMINDSIPRWVGSDQHWLVERGFWVWHGVWIAFLLGLVAVCHRSLAQEAAVHAGEASGIPEREGGEAPEACSMCRSLRRVPAGWTAWGGALAPRLLGTVRCVDCRAEYSPKTGFPDHRARFLSLGLRVGLMFFAAWLVGWGLFKVLVP